MSVGEMARRVVTFDNTATRTAASILVLLVLLQAALVWDQATSAPAKRDEILAGTDFLSVFINGAMAPTPPRRRGSRRGSIAVDNVASESQQHEAAIYRISRTSRTSQARPGSRPTTPGSPRQEGISRFYPISQKSLDHSADFVVSAFEESSSTDERLESSLSPVPDESATTTLTMRNDRPEFPTQRVIGVSVTSTVEATPYKVRVEHYVGDEMTTMSRTSATKPIRTPTTPRPATPLATSRKMPTTTTTTTTPISALLVTEEFGNLVSESNGSDFSVDEGTPRTSWRNRPRTTHRPSSVWHVSTDRDEEFRLTEPTLPSVAESRHQGRKAARHYESGIYAQTPRLYSEPSKVYGKPEKVYAEPSKVYSEPAKVYGEPAQMYGAPAKVYGEPAKVYSEPAKVYGEPEKVYAEPSKVYSEPAMVYGEPEKVYSEPAKVYSEPAKVYGEPAKVYSEPAKVYSEPAKTYGEDGQPVGGNSTERREENSEEDEPQEEQDEKNDEVDESSSIDGLGSIYGRRTLLDGGSEARGTDDGNKVGFVMEGRNYRKYRVEERTPDGFIVGEYGVVSHDDGSLRGVRYTADGSIDPQIIYDILKKYFDP